MCFQISVPRCSFFHTMFHALSLVQILLCTTFCALKCHCALSPLINISPKYIVSMNESHAFIDVSNGSPSIRRLSIFAEEDTLIMNETEDSNLKFQTNGEYAKKREAIVCDLIFGFYKFPLGYYVAMVTKSSRVENFEELGLNFCKIEEISLFHIGSKLKNVPANITAQHDRQVQRVLNTFARHDFYYSTNSDITRNIQSLTFNQLVFGPSLASSWVNADERFFWNRNLLANLINSKCNQIWIRPVVNAVIKQASFDFLGCESRISMISRRSCQHQGQRYLKRGSDLSGRVANLVETEQLLWSTHGLMSSFTQIRGSVPLFWQQKSNWKMSHPIVVQNDIRANAQAVGADLAELGRRYPTQAVGADLAELGRRYPTQRVASIHGGNASNNSIIFLNLVDKVGSQALLGLWMLAALHFLQQPPAPSSSLDSETQRDDSLYLEYSCELQSRGSITDRQFSVPLPSPSKGRTEALPVRYLWLDYHYAAHKLLKLQDRLKTHLEPSLIQRKVDGKSDLLRPQTGIIRTNCVDCLDRTNVVQAKIGKWVLLRQLASVSRHSRRWTSLENRALRLVLLVFQIAELETVFKRLWTESGDCLSVLYAGTRALKRDIVLTGHRTPSGALKDALNSVRRLFINAYQDQDRQAGVDAILGYVSNLIKT